MYYQTDFSIINKLLEDFQIDIKEPDDFEVYVFPQTWGSTALGYGGIGGQAITSASTIVLYAFDINIVRVYFGGGRLAYEIKDPNKLFFEDMQGCNLADKMRSGKYKRKD